MQVPIVCNKQGKKRDSEARKESYLNTTNDAEDEEREATFSRIRSAIGKKRFLEAKKGMRTCSGKYHVSLPFSLSHRVFRTARRTVSVTAASPARPRS